MNTHNAETLAQAAGYDDSDPVLRGIALESIRMEWALRRYARHDRGPDGWIRRRQLRARIREAVALLRACGPGPVLSPLGTVRECYWPMPKEGT